MIPCQIAVCEQRSSHTTETSFQHDLLSNFVLVIVIIWGPLLYFKFSCQVNWQQSPWSIDISTLHSRSGFPVGEDQMGILEIKTSISVIDFTFAHTWKQKPGWCFANTLVCWAWNVLFFSWTRWNRGIDGSRSCLLRVIRVKDIWFGGAKTSWRKEEETRSGDIII